MKRVVFAFAIVCALAFPVQAAWSGPQTRNDFYYCKFQAANIYGDAVHVSDVTGVTSVYWFSDDYYDYWVYLWDPGVGLVLKFSRSNGVVESIACHVGFTPTIDPGSCRK